MVSVTQRIKNYPQPYGGYISPKTFLSFPLFEDEPLHPKGKRGAQPGRIGGRLFDALPIGFQSGRGFCYLPARSI